MNDDFHIDKTVWRTCPTCGRPRSDEHVVKVERARIYAEIKDAVFHHYGGTAYVKLDTALTIVWWGADES